MLLPIGEERLPPGARAVLYVVALVSIIFSSFHVAKCLLDASLSIVHGCSAATKSTDGTVALLGVVVIACGIAAPGALLSIIELTTRHAQLAVRRRQFNFMGIISCEMMTSSWRIQIAEGCL